MRIEAAGKTWIVEERELAPGVGTGGTFYGITFRNPGRDTDILQVRWVLKPRRMTSRVARELFDMAGVRLWRDGRDGEMYRIYLESVGPEPVPGAPAPLLQSVCFQSSRGTVTARWPANLGLGFASDQELTELLDRARTGR